MAKTWQPGEDGALDRLEHFCGAHLERYADSRNLPAGHDYPEPSVDLAASRAEALAGFARIKEINIG